MKKYILLSTAVLFIASANAQWGKKVSGNGNVVTIERTTGNYNGVALSGFFDVDLVSGKEGELMLKGEENLLEHIKTEVKDGILIIKAEKGVHLKPSWNKGIHISVPIESISELASSGSGDIVGRKKIKTDHLNTKMSGSGDLNLDLDARSISIAMSGSGDLTLSGNTSDLDIKISGSGDVKAYDLTADKVTATVSGSADIKITANEQLTARVSGSGDIH